MNNNEWLELYLKWECSETQNSLIYFCDKIRNGIPIQPHLRNFVAMLLYFSIDLRRRSFQRWDDNLVSIILKKKADDIQVNLEKSDKEKLVKILKKFGKTNSKNDFSIDIFCKHNTPKHARKVIDLIQVGGLDKFVIDEIYSS